MPEFASRLDAIPMVNTTAERGTTFPTPSVGQRVQNLETGRFERYTGSSWVSLPSIDSAVSVTDHGAIGDGQTSNAAVNVTAFRAAIVAAAAGKKNLYIPAGDYRVNNNMTFDGDCSGMTVFGDGPSSLIRLSTTLDEVANVEAGWTIILDGASNGALENFRLTGLRIDGNRANITGFDIANTTVGIVGYQDSSFHNVQVDNVWTHDYLQGSGLFTYAAGIRFVDCWSFNNDYHGLAVSRSTNFGDADKFAEVINLTAHDNSGYGLDAGRYCRTIVENANLYWNTEGGFKYSIGTEVLIVRGMRCSHNLGNGFQDTDTVGTAKLDIDGVVTHNNGGLGFRIVSAGSLRIGSVNSYDNYCRTGASRSGFGYTGGSLAGCDILIGTGAGATLENWTAEYLRTNNSPTGGVLVDGVAMRYVIGRVEAEYAETFGFSDASSGTGHGVLNGGIMRGNNQAATAASAGACAIIVERAGSMKINGVILDDDQGVPTQTSGIYISSACQASVENCHFGTGLTAGSEIYSATAGTVIRFGHNNTGSLVTRARGSASEAGGAGTVTVTYPTAISNLGGLVLFPMVYPTSADACEANYISVVSRTALTLTCPGTFGGGAGAVTFRYDVQAEVQR